MKKTLDFQARIGDIEIINPNFSKCKVRVMYTGRNNNLTTINKESVERAIPTLKNIPIVGEYSQETKDYKGHGGAIDLDSYEYIHTTKPYGVVPESATYEWETIGGKEYLTIYGCYLWTGRYSEALDALDGKGQSMEIDVSQGYWDDEDESYVIEDFVFTALCILGDDVQPAFEDASINAYSLNKEDFKSEFKNMMYELKSLLNNDKEDNKMLKELLEKYSLTVEDLTNKGIKFDEISEDELEAEIIKAFDLDEEDNSKEDNKDDEGNSENEEGNKEGSENGEENSSEEEGNSEEFSEKEELESKIASLEEEKLSMQEELNELREFKLNTEKEKHEEEVEKIFNNFQLKEEDVKDLDIHKFSLDEIEEKCYAILGRKMAKKKTFNKKEENNGIKLSLTSDDVDEKPYGDLFD